MIGNSFPASPLPVAAGVAREEREELLMSAKQKLNIAYLNGALIAAAVVGLLTQSWMVAFIVGAALVAGAVWKGNIR